jgi:hypothetical protein
MNIAEFLRLYRPFHSIPTYTREKRVRRGELFRFLAGHEGVSINSRRASPTTRVCYAWDYAVFRVPPRQQGYMAAYRGELVLMICTGTWAYDVYLSVFPLIEDELAERRANRVTDQAMVASR